MARLPRLSIPGALHHVVQKGNNREPIVHNDADRQQLLDTVFDHARRTAVDLHAYVLLGNQFHLLLTPPADNSLPLLMQAVGRQYVRGFNDRHQRSGTLWEGRYRSTVLQAETHLLDAMVYLDLLPAQAGAAVQAAQYPWSSHGHYTGQLPERRLVPHPVYWALGNTPFAREAAYVERVKAGLSAARTAAIESAVLHGWALGDAAFLAQLQQQTPRRVVKARPGRPARPTP
ncbi:MAG: transposase [Hydrogenophaga sp.]|jgi:putative transposase|nr:transposase [Hydrogenophaga sp.]